MVLEPIEEAIFKCKVVCPKCWNKINVDDDFCKCGWENIVRKYNYVFEKA